MTQIYLVPGFFGFNEIGSLNYFNRVSEVLGEALAAHAVQAEIIETDTLPTGSIRRRALRLLDTVCARGGLEQDHLHFVGHSTGGLDVRMLLTPGVRLRDTGEDAEISARTRTAVTLSTPHYGTPLANFFTSLNGRNLLYLLTLLATSVPGRYSLYLGSRLLLTAVKLHRAVGRQENLLDAFTDKVLARLKPARGDDLWQFVQEISRDQGAMVQLTPEALDLFNGAARDRESVRYVSFVSASPPPNLASFVFKRRDLFEAFTHLVYAASYTIAGREHSQYPYPTPPEDTMSMIRGALPFPPGPGTSDGVVPTLSQIWGRLGGVALGDHLDVVGQFHHASRGKAYSPWVKSGSGFNEERFRRLWGEIAGAIAESQTEGGPK